MKNKVLLSLFIGLLYTHVEGQFSVVYNFPTISSNLPIQPTETKPYYDGAYLYGSAYGGTYRDGVVFRIKPDGTGDTVLHNFSGADGRNPLSSLISDGTYLYGTTHWGGTHDSGTIYRIKPDGTGFTTIYSFISANGKLPTGDLFFDGIYIYGFTGQGGTSNNGIIFRIKPDGADDTVILNFNGTNGASPNGTLISDGTYLYGAAGAGASNRGVIFRIKPDGTGDTILHNFSGSDGNGPQTPILLGGYLIGVATHGGAGLYGVIYRMNINGTNDTVLYNFKGADGNEPWYSFYYDGTYLYGTTVAGGGPASVGEIYRIKPDGTGDTVLHAFADTDGAGPSSLIPIGNYLYGYAYNGGIDSNGVIFKCGYTPTGINEPTNTNEVRVYPNPSNGVFSFALSHPELVSGSQITIYNMLGEQVYNEILNQVQNDYKINLGNESSGLYFYRIVSEKGELLESGKLVIQ